MHVARVFCYNLAAILQNSPRNNGSSGMFGNTARWSLPDGGRLVFAAIAPLACIGALTGHASAQRVNQVAAHLGPVEENIRRNSAHLQWQQHPRHGERTASRRGVEDKSSQDATEPAPSSERAADRPADPPDPPAQRKRSPRPAEASSLPDATRSRRWRGTLRRNPDDADGRPAYIIVGHQGVKQRYVRTQGNVDLDRFLDREVTVLNDTGLVLDLDQIEIGSGPRLAQSSPQQVNTQRHVDHKVEPAAYEDPPPRFRPGDPTVSSHDTTDESQTEQEQPAQEQTPDEPRVAQRVEQLPLTTQAGPRLPTGENVLIQPLPGEGSPCPTCGRQHTSSACVCGARGRWWGRAEYLLWWPNGFDVPPLATTSPVNTPQAQAGVLGQPDTSILFGNSEVLDDDFDGGRAHVGYWLRGIDKLGIEGDYLKLFQETFAYSIFGNNGSPIIARPFFNALDGAEDASLVAFPGLIEGRVTVQGASDLELAGLRLRIAACCNDLPTFGNTTSRVDFLGGYRFAELDEQLFIREDSTSLDPENPGNFLVHDAFRTHNEFHGGEAGVVWEWDRPRMTLELVGRIAIGTNQQDVIINGSTTVSDNGFSLTQPGGLLAQRTNSGHFERNRLSVIPQLSANVAFKVTQRLRLTAGYTFLYWSRVVRPGAQIDLDVNPNLFPPEVEPFDGPLRPQFAWRETDFWAHGVSAGIDYRF